MDRVVDVGGNTVAELMFSCLRIDSSISTGTTVIHLEKDIGAAREELCNHIVAKCEPRAKQWVLWNYNHRMRLIFATPWNCEHGMKNKAVRSLNLNCRNSTHFGRIEARIYPSDGKQCLAPHI